MPNITLKLQNRVIMDRKIHVIKAIRALSGLGLKDAKEIVDGLQVGATGSFHIDDNHDANREHLEVFKDQGIVIIQKTTANEYVRDARNLAIRAIRSGDYSVAEDVLNLLKTLDPSGV